MSQLHRHARDPQHFELLRVLDEYARANGVSIDDDSTHDALISALSIALRQHRENPCRLYGFRAEAMFAHVAAALGHCDIVVEEDAGIHYDSNPQSIAPDFRVLTLEGEQFFVEVKNFHQREPMQGHKFKGSYIDKLHLYADKFQLPVKIAIYWSQWGQWTLVDSTKLIPNAGNLVLPLAEAFARNEMATIGDCMIGTVPPLTIRLYADPSQPREIDGNGTALFTAGRIVLMSGDIELSSELDKKLAFYFMMYGKWTDVRQPVTATENRIDYFDISAFPEEQCEEQGFDIVGTLSSMVSNQYLDQTSDGSTIQRLAPVGQPHTLGVLIPRDYCGDDLRLWRLVQQPNFNGIKAEQTR
jgi:hypothetical protein